MKKIILCSLIILTNQLAMLGRSIIPPFTIKLHNLTGCNEVFLKINELQPDDTMLEKIVSFTDTYTLASNALFYRTPEKWYEGEYSLNWQCAIPSNTFLSKPYHQILFLQTKGDDNFITIRQSDMVFLYKINSTIEISLQPNGNYEILYYVPLTHN